MPFLFKLSRLNHLYFSFTDLGKRSLDQKHPGWASALGLDFIGTTWTKFILLFFAKHTTMRLLVIFFSNKIPFDSQTPFCTRNSFFCFRSFPIPLNCSLFLCSPKQILSWLKIFKLTLYCQMNLLHLFIFLFVHSFVNVCCLSCISSSISWIMTWTM